MTNEQSSWWGTADEEMAIAILAMAVRRDVEDLEHQWKIHREQARLVKVSPATLATCYFLHGNLLDDEYGEQWRAWKMAPPIAREAFGEMFILEGNHRANQALYEGRSIDVIILPLDWVEGLKCAVGRFVQGGLKGR